MLRETGKICHLIVYISSVPDKLTTLATVWIHHHVMMRCGADGVGSGDFFQ